MRSARITAIALATVLSIASPMAFAQRGRGGGMGNAGGPQTGAGGGMPGAAQGGPSPNMGGGTGMDTRGGNSSRSPQTATGKRPTVEEQLTQNTRLSSKLGEVLPAGTNIQQAAGGFKNLGQFVAAAHVSHNLGIPFDQLKAKMTTGKSLGDAIHELRPDVNHKAEARKAERQSRQDMKEAS